MSCDCSGTSTAATLASPSIASQLDALTLALFGSPTKTVVDGRVVWTNVCAASLPYLIAGVTPLEGEGLLCYLLRALKEVPNAILPGILTFTDAAARAAAAPQYVGQLGTQQDTNELFIGTGLVAGDWDQAPPFAGIKVFANLAARLATAPDFDGQIGTQKDTDEVYVATGTNAGDWIIAQTQTSGAFLQDAFVGTGIQTAFTLTQDPGSIVNTTVFIDGVYQNRTDAYGIAGTTLTFTEAPASGAVIQVTIGNMAVTSMVPDDLSVSTAKVIDRAITGAKIAASAVAAENMAAGAVVQVKQKVTTDILLTTLAIPFDNTVPQISEGAEALTDTITPYSTTSKILVEVDLKVASNSALAGCGVALFRNGAASAIAAALGTVNTATTLRLSFLDSPASASVVTYAVRFGNGDGVSTLGLNGQAGGASSRVYGGVSCSSLTLTEIRGA